MLDRQPISQHIQGDCGAFLMPLRGCYGGCPVGGKPPPSPPRGYTPKTAPTVAHDRFSPKIRTFLQGHCRKIFPPKFPKFSRGYPLPRKKAFQKNFFPKNFTIFFHTMVFEKVEIHQANLYDISKAIANSRYTFPSFLAYQAYLCILNTTSCKHHNCTYSLS